MVVIEIAFCGCGDVSAHHLKAIKQHADKLKVTVAIDPCVERAENVARFSGNATKTYPSLTKAIEARQKGECSFDSIFILTPHHLHVANTLEALQAGVHILLEKPIAPSLEDALLILNEAKKHKTVFMVAENAQYWPEIVRAKELINQGLIGEVSAVRAVYNEKYAGNSEGKKSDIDARYRQTDFYDSIDRSKRKEDRWRAEKNNASGMASDGGSHWFRGIRMLAGDITSVIAITGHLIPNMEGETFVRAILKTATGKTATFEASMSYIPFLPDPFFRVTGSKGEITIEVDGLYHFDGNERKLVLSPPQGYLNSFAPELLDFYLAVTEGKKLEAPPSTALGELAIAFAIYESNETKNWVKVKNLDS